MHHENLEMNYQRYIFYIMHLNYFFDQDVTFLHIQAYQILYKSYLTQFYALISYTRALKNLCQMVRYV